MAAKEESVILKYLKKNPGSEALDVSFGTDIDESVVKETLQQLRGKQQVSESVSDSGISTWNIATPPAPAAKPVAPKPVSEPRPARESAPAEDVVISDSDFAPASSGGTGKGFVIFVALLFAAIGAGASYFMVQGTISAAKSELVAKNNVFMDSVGVYKQLTNNRIAALELDVKNLKPAPEAAADPKAAAKPAAKTAVKKGKKGK